MKNQDIYIQLGNIDPVLIAEADPTAPIVTKSRKGRLRRTFAVIAACVAVFLISLLAAVPYLADEAAFRASLPDELKEYADSDYIRLIYAIHNHNTFIVGDYSSNGDSVDQSMGSAKDKSNYVEVTNNQVEGVIEGDRLKRSDTHLFYMDSKNNTVYSYKIDGENTSLVSQYKIDLGDIAERDDITPLEIYLSKDCNTLTVVIHYYNRHGCYGGNSYYVKTVLLSLDVSDPANITAKDSIYISGDYITSRSIDGKIYMVTNFRLDRRQRDYSDESLFVPQIDKGSGFKSIDMKDIVVTEGASEKGNYTVLMRVDEDSLKVNSVKAVLRPTNEVFVSEDRIILVDNYTKYVDREENGELFVDFNRFADISVFSIEKRKIGYLTDFTLAGSVEGQYSIDEYEGILRVAATTSLGTWRGDVWLEKGKIAVGDAFDVNRDVTLYGKNATLYCIDTDSWQTVAEVKDFAPWGDEVVSARFDGDKAYICTAVIKNFFDPVYFFDLSDLNNITYTDTGTIEGYSSSLVEFGDGFLLGIGYGDSRRTMKIEVYRENEGKVESVSTYIREDVYYSEDYKSYFIDRERGLVGLMFSQNKNQTYILLGFDGSEFVEILSEDFGTGGLYESARATLIDSTFYIFAYDNFKSIKIEQ